MSLSFVFRSLIFHSSCIVSVALGADATTFSSTFSNIENLLANLTTVATQDVNTALGSLITTNNPAVAEVTNILNDLNLNLNLGASGGIRLTL